MIEHCQTQFCKENEKLQRCIYLGNLECKQEWLKREREKKLSQNIIFRELSLSENRFLLELKLSQWKLLTKITDLIKIHE